MSNDSITIEAADGSGSFSAYVAKPASGGKHPAIIVIQEIFGVNKVMQGTCDRLAAEGYLAVCPDLFWRQEPGIQITDQSEEEWKRAFELYKGFDVEKGIEDLKVTLESLRSNPECDGKVGTVGFCLGGKLAFLMATRSSADANVSYYGVGLDELLGEAANIKKPLLMHIAEKDGFVPPEAQAKIKEALQGNALVEMNTYEGLDHAFTRLGGKNYNAQATVLAHNRTGAFFAKALRTAAPAQ
jgi:carboxymethylenebutenolidase